MKCKNRASSFKPRPAIASAIAALVLVSCGSIQATYWDAKIDELCRKDGGVTVYERVSMTREEQKRLGGVGRSIPIPTRQFAAPDAPYISEETTTWLSHNPDVFRRESLIVRTSDKAVLSRLVNYVRVRLEFGEPHSCQDVGIGLDVVRQTFEIKGD